MSQHSSGPKLDTETRAGYDRRDSDHWTKLEDLISRSGLSLKDVLLDYAAFIRRRDLPRLLCRYELFKKIEHLPGSIAELGVFRGSGLFTWGNLLETFCPGDRTRMVYGFDHFQGYKNLTKEDGSAAAWIDNTIGRMVSDGDFLKELIDLHTADNMLPGVERCRIIDGDITDTVSDFAARNMGVRLSMLYFDIGPYEPTVAALEHLYPLVLPGGIVAFNSYGMPPWQGEADAIESYFKPLGGVPRMQKFPFSAVPHAYFVKGEA
ncbi:MAG: class I SAM-dependent methyltransferase [Alphaproteobacteria bacterium]|nr:macrocin-O-methyltransferase [Rhodobiaceae bacterium]MBO6541681.1 class I SAM-dependent methyltransferase [Alphaproteobacteria bacterium]MBO6628924.1 class I SAM-dependent methyltransferase [Alphaproteobacteria bacterium]